MKTIEEVETLSSASTSDISENVNMSTEEFASISAGEKGEKDAQGSRKKPRHLFSRLIGALPQAVRYLSLTFLAFVTFCIGLFANLIKYNFYAQIVRDSVPYLFLGAAVLGAFITIALWFVAKMKVIQSLQDRRRFLIFVGIGVLALFALQLIFFLNMGFYPGFDPGVLAAVPSQRSHSNYFSQHPHNIFCEGIFTIIANVANAVGCPFYTAIVMVGCLGVGVSIGLASLAVHKVAGAVPGIAVFIIGAIWLGLSPTAQTPYTDSYGILFPSAVLYVYVCVRRNIIKWPLMVAISIFGYFMKAPAIAAFASIVFVELCLAIRAKPQVKIEWKKVGLGALACILSGGIAVGCAQAIRSVPDLAINENMTIGPTHYLMMGAGPSLGTYYYPDYQFSSDFDNVEERTEANLEVWRERVAQRGLGGMASLFLSKAMTAYGYGSFFWTGDEIGEVRGNNDALLSFYGIPTDEAYKAGNVGDLDGPILLDVACPWNWLAQVVWEGILIGCIWCLLRRKPSRMELVICASLLLFSGYVMLFETNPRYPFIYATFFLILGVMGWREIARIVSERYELVKERRAINKTLRSQKNESLR